MWESQFKEEFTQWIQISFQNPYPATKSIGTSKLLYYKCDRKTKFPKFPQYYNYNHEFISDIYAYARNHNIDIKIKTKT